jgi:citrate lyase subunit beta/citryl-CoA lyase
MSGEGWRTVASFRSLLVVASSDAQAVDQGLASDADALMCDLEDLVAPAEKAAARATLAAALPDRPAGGPAVIVRVNCPDDPRHAEDVRLVARLELDAVALPRATPEGVRACAGLGLPIVAVVETADGLLRATGLAGAGPVVRTVLGGKDLGAEMRLVARPDRAELLVPRALLALHATAARLAPPVDVVFPARDDLDGLISEAAYARSLGFAGKACVHDCHVARINEVFAA